MKSLLHYSNYCLLILFLLCIENKSFTQCVSISSTYTPSNPNPNSAITISGTTSAGWANKLVKIHISPNYCSTAGEIGSATGCITSSNTFSGVVITLYSAPCGNYYIWGEIPVWTMAPPCSNNPTACSCSTSTGTQPLTVSSTPPSVPTSTSGTSAGCNKFTANWNSVSGATAYYLDVSLYNNFSSFVSGFNNLNVGNVAYYNVTSLSANTQYFYRVRAYNSCGTSGNSGYISIYTTSGAPSIPTANSGSAVSCSQFTANWTSVSGATSYYLDVSLYNTFSSFVSGYNNLNVGNVTYYNVTGLSANTQYFYRIRAYNSCGTSGNSGYISIYTTSGAPSIPTANSGSAAGCSQFTANWTSVSGATSYYLDVSLYNTFSSFVSGYNNLNVGNVTYYNVTGLSASTQYFYRVRAYNSCGTSGNSGYISIYTTSSAPSIPTANSGSAAGCSQFTANWTSVSGATSYYLDVSLYNTFSSFVSGYNNLNVGNVTYYNVTCLSASTQYFYRVRAYNSCGTSGNSGYISIYTTSSAPSIPTTNSGSAAGCSQFTANWASVSGATSYYLDVSLYNTFSSFVSGYNNLNVGNVTYYNVTGLSANTQYFYRIRAYNSCGTSGNSGYISIYTISGAPSTPTATSGSSPSYDQFTANWTSISGATSYYLDVSLYNTFSSFVTGYNNLNVGFVTYYNVTGLSPNTQYFYRVRAYNSCGTSGNSGFISIYTTNSSNCSSITIQGLTICADKIIGSGPYTASGNVKIYPSGSTCSIPYVGFTGDVTINTVNNTISSNDVNCFLYNKCSSLFCTSGIQKIINGPFTFQVNSITPTKLIRLTPTLINLAMKLAGLNIKEGSGYTVFCDKLIINDPIIELPGIVRDIINNSYVNIHIPHLVITSTGTENFSNSLNFDVDIKSLLKVKLSSISYNGSSDYLSSDILLDIPFLTHIEAGYNIYNGSLNTIYLKAPLPLPPCDGIPIDETGLALSGIGGSIQNLYLKPLTLSLWGEIVPCGFYPDIFNGEIEGKLIIGGAPVINATGSINIFREPLANAELTIYPGYVNVSADINIGDILKGHFDPTWTYPTTLAGSFGATLNMPDPNYFPGLVPLYLLNPLLWFFKPGESMGDCQNYISSNSLISGYIAGKANLNLDFFGFKLPTIFYKFKYIGIPPYGPILLPESFSDNYSILPTEALDKLGKRSPSQFLHFTLHSPSNTLIIEAKNSGSFPLYEVFLPKGDTLTVYNYKLVNNIAYFKDSSKNYSCFYINHPFLGEYYIHLTNIDSTSIKVFRLKVPPMIKIQNVISNGTSIKINYHASDPENNSFISFGVDNDELDANGVIFARNIRTSNDSSYTWVYPMNSIFHGTYYIYSIIEDTTHQFFTYYYPKSIQISNSYTLKPPSNLKISCNDTALILSYIKTYSYPYNTILYYTTASTVPSFSSKSFGLGDTLNIGDTVTHYINCLKPGKFYEFMATCMDTLFHESEPSNVVSINWKSNTLNNSPVLKKQEFPLLATVNKPYYYQILADDPDKQKLTYDILITRPSNKTIIVNNPWDTLHPVDTLLKMDTITNIIDTTGFFFWVFNNKDIGYNQVYVKVSDGNLSDSAFYQILVSNSRSSQAYIAINKPIFESYYDKGLAVISDPDYESSSFISDTIKVRIFSNSDKSGIILNAFETELLSRGFLADFGFTPNQSSGNFIKVRKNDTIWVEYYDKSQSKLINEYSYFSLPGLDFNMNKDTICSGDSVKFFASTFGYNIKSYHWSFTGYGIENTKGVIKSFIATKGSGFQKIDVILTITDTLGKKDSIVKSLFIDIPVVNLGNDTVICGDVTLTAKNSLKPPIYYLWSNGSTEKSIIIKKSGTYDVKVRDGFNCIAKDTVTIIVYPRLMAPKISFKDNYLQSSYESGNQWYDSNGLIDGAVGNRFYPKVSGKYFVLAKIGNCYSDTSEIVMVIVIVGLQDKNLLTKVKIYPNPAHDQLFIEILPLMSGTWNVSIFNNTGKCLINRSLSNNNSIIDISNLPKGVYIVKVKNDRGEVTYKLIKE